MEAYAQATAQVTWVQGTVEQYVRGVPPPRPVAVGAVLSQGDRLVTKAGASVEFRLPDGSLVKLGEQATVNLQDLQFDPATGKKSAVLGLVWGKVRALVGKIAAPRDRFEIHTPTGIAGVTGTDWGSELSAPPVEDFLNFDGGVSGGGRTEPRRAIPPGHWGRLVSGRLSDPQLIPPSVREAWNREMSFQAGAPGAHLPSDVAIDLALGAIEEPIVQRRLIPPGSQEGAPVHPPYRQEPPAAQQDFRPPPPPPPLPGPPTPPSPEPPKPPELPLPPPIPPPTPEPEPGPPPKEPPPKPRGPQSTAEIPSVLQPGPDTRNVPTGKPIR